MALKSSSIPPFGQRVMIYALVVVVAVGASVAGVRWLGLGGEETLMVEGAILFLIAGSGLAPRLFAAVRQGGEFSGVSNDRLMQSILIIIAALILIGVYVLRMHAP